MHTANSFFIKKYFVHIITGAFYQFHRLFQVRVGFIVFIDGDFYDLIFNVHKYVVFVCERQLANPLIQSMSAKTTNQTLNLEY